MKKFQILAVSCLSVALILTGCKSGVAPEKTPQEVVKEGFSNLYDIDAYAYELKMKGDANVEGETVNFDLTIDGAQDMSLPADPKLILNIMASGSLNGGEAESVEAELRLDKTKLFFMVGKLTDFDGLIPTESVSTMLGKWWMMDIPEGTFDNLTVASGNEAELSPELQETKELLKETEFFSDLTYVGEEKGAYKYTGSLDKEAVKEFVRKGSEINGETVSDADVAELDSVLAMVELTVEIWVDKDTMTATGLAGNVNVNAEEEGMFNFDFEYHLSDINQAVIIEEPAGAELFDPLQLLMGGMPQ